ncbi:hypothetical protein B857_00079 [Solibacillus isronensis B3W22]|uniref:Uncharacterized protein n=1 Tax=Solibacillus isronensis B3W22 TaxID=1224748 RepID=K1KRM5_9BACL|nr:ATP-grasp fold amidoligase family protein [Solibacillus isronensis]AMO84771.1 hypothetical protein SOLI23_03995 [Solibacillus silvestris]EKB46790.1 hypothetical protein B857_00079 [Solibacillus isronensis B3W22]
MQIPVHAKRYAFTQVVKLSPIAASKILYWNRFKTRLNLENPKTFNEKLMWLKLFEDVEFKRRFTDKVKAREYMITVGYNYLLPPLIGIFDEIEDIIFEQLPRKFVLKCSHGEGMTIVCENKREMDYRETRQHLAEMMATDYSLKYAEPHYSSIIPRIIIERLIESSTGDDVQEYNIHCFHGVPKIIEATFDRFTPKEQTLMLTPDWFNTNYLKKKLPFDEAKARPAQLDELLAIAKKLSKPFTYVRIDLKVVDEKVYFNNFTFTPDACLNNQIQEDDSHKLGQWLDLDIGKSRHPVTVARSKY